MAISGRWWRGASALGPRADAPRPFVSTRLIIAVGVGLVALDLYGPTSSVAMLVVAIGTPACLVVGVHRYRPRRPALWWTTVLALVLFFIDGVLRTELDTLGNLTVHRSLVPDLVALPGYLLLASSLAGFVICRTNERKLRLGIVYDGAIAGLAALACSWVYLIEPVLAHRRVVESVRAILICYPALSLCLLVVTVQIAFSAERRKTPAERYLVATMCSMFLGDTLYMLAELHLIGSGADLLDLPYLGAYVFAACCASSPSMRGLTEPAPAPRPGWSVGRVVLIAVAFTVPALLVLQAHEDGEGERIALFLIIVALTSTAILQILQALKSVERSEAMLRFQALHDSLTGLPNRRQLEHHLDQALAASDGDQLAVLFLDLDRFKLINDTLGHSHGDDLLIQVARRLEREVGPSDLVARVGGDEFVVVLAQVASPAWARSRANQLRHALRAPIAVEATEFFVTASIGLACARGGAGAMDAESLIRDADTAMYEAKAAGRDAVAAFDDSMRAQLAERIEIERDLHHAIARGELELAFQPVVVLPATEPIGVEALLRWTHPRLGPVAPSRFIPLAEESSLIIDLGAFVLDGALRELAQWRRESRFAALSVAVNLSAVELRDERLVDRIASTLARYGLPGSALCIELTESAVMEDPEQAIDALSALRRLEIRLAVDDFGTQYSSLAYLQRLPVDVLKIDRSFVDGLRSENSSDASLVAAIVAMARALSIETVAEGVETLEQAMRLVALGADAAQGYYFARPARPEDLPAVLATLGADTASGARRPPALAGGAAAPR